MKYAGMKRSGKVRVIFSKNKINPDGEVVKEEKEGVVVYSSGQRLTVESDGELFYFTRHGLWCAQTEEQVKSYKDIELLK